MKIIHKDLKHGIIKVKVEGAEDLWYLESIIEPDDLVSGMSERKIKIGGSDERSKISRINVFLKLRVEKIDHDSSLRVSGIIMEAPEDVPHGDHHTFNIEEGTIITIEKKQWTRYVLKKLEESTKNDSINILIVAFDREEAIFALLKNNGYEILLDLKGDVSKKDQEEKKGNFYKEIIAQMIDYDTKHSFTNIILASPAFWKEYLLKELDNDALRKKITTAACSSIDESSINEILKRPELKTVLDKDKSARESGLIEELLDAVRKDNAAYGLEQVSQKINAGNVSILLVSENLIRKSREEKTYFEIDRMMDDAEAINADVKIISSEDAAKKLDGLTGMACLFRWKENYE
jgi:protein pelota